jgi:hypothetical protein
MVIWYLSLVRIYLLYIVDVIAIINGVILSMGIYYRDAGYEIMNGFSYFLSLDSLKDSYEKVVWLCFIFIRFGCS